MTLSGLRTRALLSSCAYVFVVIALVSVAVTATLALSPNQRESESKVPVAKIGPGYARMQPIDEGKPEKVLYTKPYSIPVRAHVVASKRAAPSIETLIAQTAPPVYVAVVQPSYSAPDFHRIY